MMYLTRDISVLLLVAVLEFGLDYTEQSTFIQLSREAEVALEPNLMFLSFSASRRKNRI